MYISLNNFNKFQSIYSIKEDINNNFLKKSVKASQISLIYNGKILDDNKTLYHYNVKNTDSIKVNLKKKGGETAASVGLLVLGIFVTLILIVFIIIGILPFLSFLFSKIFIKGFTLILDFLRSLTSQNNFLNSFIATVKSIIIPVISFIFYYFGLIVIIYFIVFFCIYGIYNFIYKDCRAFKAAGMVAKVTVLFLVLFYILGNLPNIFNKISKKLLPGFISGIISKICEALSNFRLVLIGIFPGGSLITVFIDIMTKLFELLNKSKFYGPQVLYEWDKMFAYTRTPDVNRMLRESKLRTFVNGLNAANKYEYGKTVGEVPHSSIASSGFVFVRFFFQTMVYLFIRFVEIFDICGDKPEEIIVIEKDIKDTQNLIDNISKALNDPSTENSERKELRETLQKLTKTIAKLTQNKDKEERLKMLDVTCLREILINGAFAGFPTVLIFLVLFILMCIPSMVAKIGG